MKYEAEDPTGNFLATLFPSILGAGEFGKSSSEYSVFVTWRVAILLFDPGPLPMFPIRI